MDAEKRDASARAARDYARRAEVEWQRTRFDIVSIVLDRAGTHRMAPAMLSVDERRRYNTILRAA